MIILVFVIYFNSYKAVKGCKILDIACKNINSDASRQIVEDFRLFFNNLPQAVALCRIMYDDQGNPVDYIALEVNTEWERLTNIKREVFLKNTLSKVFPFFKDRQLQRDKLAKIIKSRQSEIFEIYYEPLRTWLQVSAYSPRESYLILVGFDITKRKQAETASLRASEQTQLVKKRLEAILEAVPASVVMVDKNLKISFANKYASALYDLDNTGLDFRALLKKLNLKKENGESYKLDEVPAVRSLRGEKVNNEELILQRPNGEFLPVLVSSAPLYDANGNVISSVVLVRDISDRKKVEDALKESEQRYHAIFYNTDEAFALCEMLYNKKGVAYDFRILEVNKVFEEVYGVEAEDVCGKTPEEINLIYKNYVGRYKTYFKPFTRFLKTGKPYRFEYHEPRTGLDFDVHAFRIDENKFAFMASNVTSQKKLEKQLKEYSMNLEKLVELRTKQLKEKERLAAIGETAGMVGHDIRNPLQAIIGDLYLIKNEIATIPRSTGKKAALESIRAIDENIYYINKIVSDLHDYTRQLEPHFKEVNISNLIKKSLRSIKIPKNIETVFLVDDMKIKVDPEYIKRIITNLVLNAVQAMPKGGKLTIEVHKSMRDYDFIITDTGVGIPDEVKPKLFRPLFTTKSKGQGFGLSVVKRIVEVLDGSISFESEKGKGTKFTIRLPLINEP